MNVCVACYQKLEEGFCWVDRWINQIFEYSKVIKFLFASMRNFSNFRNQMFFSLQPRVLQILLVVVFFIDTGVMESRVVEMRLKKTVYFRKINNIYQKNSRDEKESCGPPLFIDSSVEQWTSIRADIERPERELGTKVQKRVACKVKMYTRSCWKL